jgi:hypothetical protein
VSEFVPSGHISIREALNRLGREMFPSEWTGEEHKARRGLISQEEWLKSKDLIPARGSGASDAGQALGRTLASITEKVSSTGDPSSPVYQAEYRESERYTAARQRLRALLEGGDLEAAILDPFTGTLYRAPASLWRQHGSDRMIEKGHAPIPRSRNVGQVLVKAFAEASEPAKPMPAAKIRDVIEALKARIATESLTRPQQAEFVRKKFPTYHLTARQLREIFGQVKVATGRPKKSDKAV